MGTISELMNGAGDAGVNIVLGIVLECVAAGGLCLGLVDTGDSVGRVFLNPTEGVAGSDLARERRLLNRCVGRCVA